MNEELFLRLLRNLLAVPAITVNDPERDLRAFEENNCYNKLLQPMFTGEALSFLLESCSPGIIYEIVDQLDVCAIFFSWENRLYLMGPYVKSEFSTEKTETLLMENHMPSSHLVSLKLYYTALPFVYSNQIQNVINGCILSFFPEATPLGYRHLSGFVQEKEESVKGEESDTIDYSDIYRRYDTEHQFLAMIRNGDVENVQRSYKNMSQNGINSIIWRQHSSYSNPMMSTAIIRTLARKAAEESGLSVITINEITQHYVQLMESESSREKLVNHTMNLILELTQAVHDYKISRGKYSIPIQKAMEYVEYHLSERLPLDVLSANAHVSTSHLTKLFKKETGATISAYIAKERCKKAAEYLKSTELPIQEISEYVGYSDNNYFVKVFRKVYGTTPSEYRSQN